MRGLKQVERVFLLILLLGFGLIVHDFVTGAPMVGKGTFILKIVFGAYARLMWFILALGGMVAILAFLVWDQVARWRGVNSDLQDARAQHFSAVGRPPDHRRVTGASDGQCLSEGIREMKRILPCCGLTDTQQLTGLPHVYGFDFDLFQCGQCSRYWVHAWRSEESQDWEEATVEDAEKMQSLGGNELRAFMKEWARSFD